MLNRKNVFSLITMAMIISLVSCNPSKKYAKEEQAMIDNYLTSNPALSFEQKESGLYICSVQEGTGIMPVLHDTVYVKYTGSFLSGQVFDTNVGKADSLTFPVLEGWMIAGFDEGVSYLKQGGKAIILCPSWLAYGATGRYGFVNGYTPLLFEIELVKVKKSSGK
jgi:FKBP-type peptidyl-prolyl cis-trans isomerase FkpA